MVAVERSDSALENLQTLVADGLALPTVFQAPAASWARSPIWAPQELRKISGDTKTDFRVWPVASGFVWETDCPVFEATFEQFAQWLDMENGQRPNLPRSNPFHPFPYDKVCVYAGYKEMLQLFGVGSPVFEIVDWQCVGLPGRDGSKSVFWMGTKGAYTPCHYDTYGYNVVTQLYGRKRWTLYPPSDERYLYPTRIPYEESSVFSAVDHKQPDSTKYPLFAGATKYEVVLEPGDVLFVPNHWWHLVESLETSISVNTWVEQETDKVDRIGEAVARTLVSAIKTRSTSSQGDWLNPSETLDDQQCTIGLLQLALKQALSSRDCDSPNTQPTDTESHSVTANEQQVESEAPCHSGEPPSAKRTCPDQPGGSDLVDQEQSPTSDMHDDDVDDGEDELVTLETALLNAILSPDCLKMITSKLIEEFPRLGKEPG